MPTLTINAPSGSTVEINGTERSTLTATAGTSVNWKVCHNEKGTRSGSLTLNEDVTLDVKFVSGSFNINFLTNEAFDAMGTPESNGIYAVECDPVIEFFPTKEDILTGVADGSVWYRLYKSGWLEQGGIAQYTDTEQAIVNFAKPFANCNYTILMTPSQTSYNNGIAAVNLGVKVKETTRFQTFLNPSSVPKKEWSAYGYAGEIEETGQEGENE